MFLASLCLALGACQGVLIHEVKSDYSHIKVIDYGSRRALFFVGDKELNWKTYQAKEHFFDFNDSLGVQTEDSVGYAVCYIESDADRNDVKLKVGSDDQCVVYLNGKEVLKVAEARALEKDQNTAEVSLRQGVNVLVFKVVNEKIDWSGCARFTDENNRAVKGLKATAAPK